MEDSVLLGSARCGSVVEDHVFPLIISVMALTTAAWDGGLVFGVPNEILNPCFIRGYGFAILCPRHPNAFTQSTHVN
jgi:hypothetical protein